MKYDTGANEYTVEKSTRTEKLGYPCSIQEVNDLVARLRRETGLIPQRQDCITVAHQTHGEVAVVITIEATTVFKYEAPPEDPGVNQE